MLVTEAILRVRNEILKNFCFPGGVDIKPVKTETELNSVIFGSLSHLETAENSFVFVITDDHLYYGTCVMTHELLRVRIYYYNTTCIY